MFTSQKNVHTHAHVYTCVRIHNIHTHTDAVTYCWPVIPNVHLLREQLLLVQLVRRQKQIYRTSSFTICNFANLHFCLCILPLSLSISPPNTSGSSCGYWWHTECWQSCRMSIFLHGAKPSSQILPDEKRVNRDHFGPKIDKGGTFGEQMLMFLSNYESF